MKTFDEKLKDFGWAEDLCEENRELIKNKIKSRLDADALHYWTEPEEEENND